MYTSFSAREFSTEAGETMQTAMRKCQLEGEHHRSPAPSPYTYNMFQRWYSPETGRFASRAPYAPHIEPPYDFAEDDPVTKVDPKGTNVAYTTDLPAPGPGRTSFLDRVKDSCSDYRVHGPGNTKITMLLPGPDVKTCQIACQQIFINTKTGKGKGCIAACSAGPSRGKLQASEPAILR